MTALTRFWDECRVLVGQTIGAWRSLLPLLLLLQILGWFSFEGSKAAAAVLSLEHAWIALGVFSVGFVMALVVAVLMMRIVGDHLGSAAMIPEPDADEQDEGRVGFTRMLALTLLPLLALYAAFGKIEDALRDLTLITFTYYGSLGDNLLVVLNPSRAGVGTVIGVLLGAYVLRRLLDLAHVATGWRWIGLLVSITEAFFVMGLVLAAARWISDLRFWLRNREFMAWWDTMVDGLATAFAMLRFDLPAFLAWMGPLWEDDIFPSLVKAVTGPLVWLAVAALVFGSRVVSVADLWRKGQPLTSRVPGARNLTLVRKITATAETDRSLGVGRRVGLWLQETLLGDIDDKYLPTLHALRLVLKAGLPFLAALVLLHNAVEVSKTMLTVMLRDAIGGQETLFWTGLLPGIALVVGLALETVRLTLLAVAFHRCLQLFRAAAHPSDHPVPAPMPRRSQALANTWRKLRGAVALLLAVFVLSTAGWMVGNHLLNQRMDFSDGRVGEPVPMGGFEITATEVQYGQVTSSSSSSVVVTPSRWVKVRVRASTSGPGGALEALLIAPNVEYRHNAGSLIVGDGTWAEFDLLFEVADEDLADVRLVVRPSTETSVRLPAARIDLTPDADASTIVDESAWVFVPRATNPETGGN